MIYGIHEGELFFHTLMHFRPRIVTTDFNRNECFFWVAPDYFDSHRRYKFCDFILTTMTVFCSDGSIIGWLTWHRIFDCRNSTEIWENADGIAAVSSLALGAQS